MYGNRKTLDETLLAIRVEFSSPSLRDKPLGESVFLNGA